MSSVKKLDTKRRAVFPDCFAPGDIFIEKVDAHVITYTLIQPDDLPVAEIEEQDGKHFVKMPSDTNSIAAAIRKDRDSR